MPTNSPRSRIASASRFQRRAVFCGAASASSAMSFQAMHNSALLQHSLHRIRAAPVSGFRDRELQMSHLKAMNVAATACRWN